jgi:hydrogenase/urease accessory protein HupE
MKKITSMTAISSAALISQSAAAHDGHHDSGLSELLAHMSAHPDHWLAFISVAAAVAGSIYWLQRRSKTKNEAKNSTR